MTDASERPADATRTPDPVTGFDEFYKDARDRLLVQTFALTGDLTAARSAVRDAFVVAWHHWRKLTRHGDPESSVRSQAWRNGLRRTTARPWGRKQDLDEATRDTLDALASISVDQRKAVLLTQLAGAGTSEAARELGVPREGAEREVAAGTALFAHDRGIEAGEVPATLAALDVITRTVSWPRVTIIRRAGSARRRAHTLLGATVAVAAVLGAGVAVTDTTGARPTLARVAHPEPTAPSQPVVQLALPQTSMLPVDAVRRNLRDKGWRAGRTSDNSTGNGLVQPCQRTRYADSHGLAAWVRGFSDGHGKRAARYVQTAEASASDQAAERTYRHALRWFTACIPPANTPVTQLPHTRLLSTALAPGLGDEAAVVVLQTSDPDASYVVGLARTGQLTTATSLRLATTPRQRDREHVAKLLATAVDRLCGLAGGGGCATTPVRIEDAPAFPVGRDSALLAEIDLPPVGLRHGRLVGTPAREVTGDPIGASLVGCKAVHLVGRYAGAAIHANLERTFVFIKSDLPAETGLTQVVGTLPKPKAARFAATMRHQLDRCPDLDASAGTDITTLSSRHHKDTDLVAWRLSTALSDKRSVDYDVALVRDGSALSQLVYVSAPGARLADSDFVAVAERALERATELRAY